jgi:hypothetical protein
LYEKWVVMKMKAQTHMKPTVEIENKIANMPVKSNSESDLWHAQQRAGIP